MQEHRQKSVLLCLHGWGASKESFTELRAALEGSDIELHTPDLPGFGDEPEPKHGFTNDDYVDFVLNYIKENISGDYMLLSHSLGGRISIKLATRPNAQLSTHLFLCAPAGIRHPRHLKRVFGLILSKTGKFFLSIPGLKVLKPIGKKLLYRLVRVHDYEKVSGVMRQTLINVTKEDLRDHLKDIPVETDLFWGTDDGVVPYSDAKIMEKEIPRATLHTYPKVHHRVHRDRANEIAVVIRERFAANSGK